MTNDTIGIIFAYIFLSTIFYFLIIRRILKYILWLKDKNIPCAGFINVGNNLEDKEEKKLYFLLGIGGNVIFFYNYFPLLRIYINYGILRLFFPGNDIDFLKKLQKAPNGGYQFTEKYTSNKENTYTQDFIINENGIVIFSRKEKKCFEGLHEYIFEHNNTYYKIDLHKKIAKRYTEFHSY